MLVGAISQAREDTPREKKTALKRDGIAQKKKRRKKWFLRLKGWHVCVAVTTLKFFLLAPCRRKFWREDKINLREKKMNFSDKDDAHFPENKKV